MGRKWIDMRYGIWDMGYEYKEEQQWQTVVNSGRQCSGRQWAGSE